MKIAIPATAQESPDSIAAAGQQFLTDNGTPCHGGRNRTLLRRCGIASTGAALVVATLLLLSDQVDESIACPAKANETNELQQLFLIMDEESTVLAYPSQLQGASAGLPHSISEFVEDSAFLAPRSLSETSRLYEAAVAQTSIGQDQRPNREGPP